MSSSRKRSSSAKNPTRKHTGAAMEERRSMAALADARRERLQMLSLVPDDVLRMVRDFVYRMDSDDMSSIASALPLMYMLGAPFAPPPPQELPGDVVAKMAHYMSDDVKSVVNFVRDMKVATSPDVCVKIGARLRRALPKTVWFRDERTLITIVLEGKSDDKNLIRCNASHRILCALLAAPEGDVAAAVAVDPLSIALSIALGAKLWHKADVLTRAPYNQVEVHSGFLFQLFREHADGESNISVDLLHRLVDINVSSANGIALDLLHHGVSEHFEWLVANHASSIDGDKLLYVTDIYGIHDELVPRMLASALPHLATTSHGRIVALSASLSKGGIWQPVVDWLLSQPHCKVELCIKLAKRGELALAEPYLATLDHPDDVRAVLDAYVPKHSNSGACDVDIMTRLPAVKAHLPDSRALDRLLMMGCGTPEFCEAALAAGMRVRDLPWVLADLLTRGSTALARMIITSGSCSGDELAAAIVIAAQKNHGFSPDVRPALETGLVDARQLLVGLCMQDAATHSSIVLGQIADFYRVADDSAFMQRLEEPNW